MTMNLQNKMFQEMEAKDIFEQAKGYAFDYADKALERNVFPTDAAINNLNQFVGDIPDVSSDAADILKQLHTHGSPASVSLLRGGAQSPRRGSSGPARNEVPVGPRNRRK